MANDLNQSLEDLKESIIKAFSENEFIKWILNFMSKRLNKNKRRKK